MIEEKGSLVQNHESKVLLNFFHIHGAGFVGKSQVPCELQEQGSHQATSAGNNNMTYTIRDFFSKLKRTFFVIICLNVMFL